MNKLESGLIRCENMLSCCAAVPFLGVIPASIKIAMGSIQTITSIAIGILFIVPAICGNNFSEKVCRHAFTHIKHGLANIGIGFVEGIPVVGLIAFFVHSFTVNNRGKLNEDVAFNFYPYPGTPIRKDGKNKDKYYYSLMYRLKVCNPF